MDFAADAVFDVATPPARPTPAREARPEPDNGPSFDDHLQAATREDETAAASDATARPEQTGEQKAADQSTDPADALLGGEVAPIAPPATDPAASPVFVQLIADTTQPAQQADTQATAPNTVPAAASAPIQPAAPPPMQVAANTQDAAPSKPVAPAPDAKPATQKNNAPAEKSATPASPAEQTAPATAQPQTALTTPAPATAAPTAPATEAADAALTGVTPVQTPAAAPEHAERQPKTASAQNDAKTDVAPATDRNTAPVTTAPPRGHAKSATPQGAVKDTAAAFASLLDAPEAAPQQQGPSAAPAPAAASSTQTQHAVAEQSAARAAPAAHQVGREIVRKFDGGNTRFELRLDPPELGRVEVRMEVSRDHRVTAVIAADSPQALTELARHARDLEQMLQGAGLELSDSGLSFDLRRGREQAETAEFGGSVADGAPAVEDTAPVTARPIGYERWRGVRVDMMV